MKNTNIEIISVKKKGFNFKKKQYNKKMNNKNKVYIIIFLSIFYFFLIYLEIKKRFVKYIKKEKLKIDNYNKLKNITKNNIKYKGLENYFLYNKEEDHCIYQLLIPKKVVNKNLTLLGGKKRWWICYY